VEGTPITVGAGVVQVAVAPEHGARPARLHRHAEVIRCGQRGRGNLRLYVRFEGESELVSIRPHLVRVMSQRPEAGDAPR
jgi:hypothetical protein